MSQSVPGPVPQASSFYKNLLYGPVQTPKKNTMQTPPIDPRELLPSYDSFFGTLVQRPPATASSSQALQSIYNSRSSASIQNPPGSDTSQLPSSSPGLSGSSSYYRSLLGTQTPKAPATPRRRYSPRKSATDAADSTSMTVSPVASPTRKRTTPSSARPKPTGTTPIAKKRTPSSPRKAKSSQKQPAFVPAPYPPDLANLMSEAVRQELSQFQPQTDESVVRLPYPFDVEAGEFDPHHIVFTSRPGSPSAVPNDGNQATNMDMDPYFEHEEVMHRMHEFQTRTNDLENQMQDCVGYISGSLTGQAPVPNPLDPCSGLPATGPDWINPVLPPVPVEPQPTPTKKGRRPRQSRA